MVRSARAGHVRCSARFTGRKCRSRVWISLSAKPILASGRKTRKQAGHMSASDPSMLPELILQVGGRPHMNRAAKLRLGLRLRSLAQELRSSSPGALGKGARRHEVCRRRYHCPVPGCPLNRSSLTGVGTSSTKSDLITALSLCLPNLPWRQSYPAIALLFEVGISAS